MRLDFGLVGKTLGHSFSKTWFTNKFQEGHIRATYHNFELQHVEHVAGLATTYDNLRGFNVTIPYKRAVLPFLSGLSPIAEKVGAVNTVLVENGKYFGYNTDVIGFRDSLNEFYDGAPGGKALVLGTGGASSACGFVLNHYFQFEAVEFASRNPRAKNHVGYDTLTKTGLEGYRLIVNATPVGMAPNVEAFPPLPYETLLPETHLYDLIYNPEDTVFLQKGQARGCKTIHGMDMLIRQAEASWEIWMGES